MGLKQEDLMNELVPLSEVLDEVFPWGMPVAEEGRRATRRRRRRERWAFAGILITGLLGVAVVLLAAYGLMVVR